MGLSMTQAQKFTLIEGLQQRVSHPRLQAPAPTREELETCYQAAFRVPDHAYLRPWRFVEITDEARGVAGSLIAEALKLEQPDLTEAAYQKAETSLLRAPLVIMVYASCTEHPKVPRWEQEIAVGCAAYAFTTALFSFGYGSVWRTGDAANSIAVKHAFGLTEQEKIIGFLYVGTPERGDKAVPVVDSAHFVRPFNLRS